MKEVEVGEEQRKTESLVSSLGERWTGGGIRNSRQGADMGESDEFFWTTER